MTLPVYAVILAAGNSTRMGSPKQLLLLNKKPLLEHCINKCLDLPVQEVMVITGHLAEKVRRGISIHDSRLRWVYNEDFQKGLSSSFQRAVKEIEREGLTSFMVFLGDQRFISIDTVKRICRLGMDLLLESKDPFVIRPFYMNKPGHPVFWGNFNKEALAQVQGDIGAKKLIARCMQSIQLDVKDPYIVFDIDTPEDFAEAVKINAKMLGDKTRKGVGWL